MSGTLLSLVYLVCVPEPQFVPVPQFVPIPKFAATIRDTLIVEVPIEKAPPSIVRWEKQCGPNGCQLVPIYADPPQETVADAAYKLRGWRGLSKEEVKRLSEIVDAPIRAKHLSPGACRMLGCPEHPGHDVFDDEESQAETDAGTVPWPSGGTGWYLGKWIGKIVGRQ